MPGVKSFDAIIITRNNELWEFKEPQSNNPYAQVFNSMKSAKKQKAENVLIKLNSNNPQKIIKGLLGVIGKDRRGSIKKIWIMYQSKVIAIPLRYVVEQNYEALNQLLETAL